MQCDYGQVYLSCGPICQKTCFSDDSNTCPQNVCVEGCFCPNGYALNDIGNCVPQNQCPCRENGVIYSHGQVFGKPDCQVW